MNKMHTAALLLTALTVAATPGVAQDAGVTQQMLLNPPPDSWPLYHGDYSAKRHVKFTQITPENVDQLALAWMFPTNQSAAIKASPLLVNGVLYFTIPENVWAVDARSGHLIWHYEHPHAKAFLIGHRGLGMYGNWLYFTTADGHL